jgi:mannosyl-oligosaccharide alpha-1,2-mannosidase
MNIPEIVNQIVDYVPDINWSVSVNNQPVSLFETTIRYVAGLLSGYDLLSGPRSGLVDDVSIILQILGGKTKLIWTRKQKSTLSCNKRSISPTT